MKKRFVGVPIPIIVAALVILLAGGTAIAAFLVTRTVPSTVQIVGAGAGVYSDEACTVPLVDLDFGAIEAGGATPLITFWVENSSDGGYDIYVALSQVDLDPLLTLYAGEANPVPRGPANLPLATGSEYQEGYWGETATTSTLLYGMEASSVDMGTSTDSFPSSGTVKIDDELILYGSVNDAGGEYLFEGLTRGAHDTTAAAHNAGSIVTLMEWVEPVDEPLYGLAPGGTLPVTVYMEADSAIERGHFPFTTIIIAQGSPF